MSLKIVYGGHFLIVLSGASGHSSHSRRMSDTKDFLTPM